MRIGAAFVKDFYGFVNRSDPDSYYCVVKRDANNVTIEMMVNLAVVVRPGR